MSEMTEQERGAAVIARSPQRYADLRAITELRSFSPEETVLLVRVANAGADLIQAQHRELDRLTAERDAARKEMAELVARLTKIADENETVCREHTSVGNDQDDAWVSAWGAAGKELREALGIESEASE